MADQRIAFSRAWPQTARMLRSLAAAIAATLLLAAPALAQDPAPTCTGSGDVTVGCDSGPTVGDPDVITDPADEVDEPSSGPVEPEDPRAEQHVLGDSAEASSDEDTAAGTQDAGSEPSAAPQSAADSSSPGAPAAQATPGSGTSGTLPFTGVDAWLLALAGSALLAAGLRLRAAADR
jgi:hypothetical protein